MQSCRTQFWDVRSHLLSHAVSIQIEALTVIQKFLAVSDYIKAGACDRCGIAGEDSCRYSEDAKYWVRRPGAVSCKPAVWTLQQTSGQLLAYECIEGGSSWVDCVDLHSRDQLGLP